MMRRTARRTGRRTARRTTRRTAHRMHRRRRRRRVLVGGAVLVAAGAAAYGAYKLTQPDVDRIEQHTGQSVEDVEQWPNRISAVTVEQVNAAARAILRPETSTR